MLKGIHRCLILLLSYVPPNTHTHTKKKKKPAYMYICIYNHKNGKVLEWKTKSLASDFCILIKLLLSWLSICLLPRLLSWAWCVLCFHLYHPRTAQHFDTVGGELCWPSDAAYFPFCHRGCDPSWSRRINLPFVCSGMPFQENWCEP